MTRTPRPAPDGAIPHPWQALDRLTEKLRKSASINWQNRKDARAKMIAQAELLADTWSEEQTG